MYFYLLQAYCKANDADKALSVWTSLQEENIQPTTELLSFLADFLRKNNLPIPFAPPAQDEEDVPLTESSRRFISGRGKKSELGDEATLPRTTNPLVKKFRQSIEINDIDVALQMKQR